MASLRALASLAFLLLAARGSMSSVLEDRCRHFAASEKEGYDYCLKTLGADKASAKADEFGLAAIALKIARASAMATGARLARLQGAETVPARRECLAKCAADYTAAVRRLGHAAKDAARGQTREALAQLSKVLGAPYRCDHEFKDAGESSPLVPADRELNDKLSLALGILPRPRTTATRV